MHMHVGNDDGYLHKYHRKMEEKGKEMEITARTQHTKQELAVPVPFFYLVECVRYVRMY